MSKGLVFLTFLLVFEAMKDKVPACHILGSPELPLLSKQGEFVIGGAFSIHSKLAQTLLSFREKPTRLTCSR